MSDFEWNRILHGDVLAKIEEIPDNSIDCLVTSPPYYGLRDYGIEGQIWDDDNDCEHEWTNEILVKDNKHWEDFNWKTGGKPKKEKHKNSEVSKGNFCNNCNAWKGPLGLEPTFHMFIDHLVQIFNALRPKLCDHGSLWINLGDTYYGGGNAQGHTGLTTNLGKSTLQRDGNQNPVARGTLLPRKTLIGIPDRFKIAMIDNGWICRNDIIWYKRSTMPSSARDRFTVDYERFFFFTKKPKYYFKQQFEPQSEHTLTAFKDGIRPLNPKQINNPDEYKAGKTAQAMVKEGWQAVLPLGRNKRTVWDINPAQFKEAHFATFPEKLIEIPIDASCPKLVCTECGKPQEQIIKFSGGTTGESWHDHSNDDEQGMHQSMSDVGRRSNEDGDYKKEITGWTKCDCNAPFRKGRVLDPFMGAGTTALVAHKQGKDWLGIELKEEYIKIANQRLLNNTDILLQRHFEFD